MRHRPIRNKWCHFLMASFQPHVMVYNNICYWQFGRNACILNGAFCWVNKLSKKAHETTTFYVNQSADLVVAGDRDQVIAFILVLCWTVFNVFMKTQWNRGTVENLVDTSLLWTLLTIVRSREGPGGETVVVLETLCSFLNMILVSVIFRRTEQENSLPSLPPTHCKRSSWRPLAARI